jgi:hypothetical protein
MTSLSDFDQGGTVRSFTTMDLGPSVGLVRLPSSLLPITAPGVYQLQTGITLVEISVAGAVSIRLPSSTNPKSAMAQGSLFGNQSITLVDVGGFAGANPITVLPFGSEKIMGLVSFVLGTPYDAATLVPIPPGGWNLISP